MPLLKGNVWYWLDKRFLSLIRREVKPRYTDIEIYTMGYIIDGMGISKLMELVRWHEEEQHVSEIVPIGERNPNCFKPQVPDPKEWDVDDDAHVDNT